MTARRGMQILSVLACVALVAAPALAGDGTDHGGGNDHGLCTLDGAWWGWADLPGGTMHFMVVYDSETHWWGTLELTWIGGDPSFGGFFGAVAFSDVKGQWHRIGHRTFEYTMTFYGLGDDGLPVYIDKMSGVLQLEQGCEEEAITATSEIYFDPNANPVLEDGNLCVDHGSAIGAMRMSIDPPCVP